MEHLSPSCTSGQYCILSRPCRRIQLCLTIGITTWPMLTRTDWGKNDWKMVTRCSGVVSLYYLVERSIAFHSGTRGKKLEQAIEIVSTSPQACILWKIPRTVQNKPSLIHGAVCDTTTFDFSPDQCLQKIFPPRSATRLGVWKPIKIGKLLRAEIDQAWLKPQIVRRYRQL